MTEFEEGLLQEIKLLGCGDNRGPRGLESVAMCLSGRHKDGESTIAGSILTLALSVDRVADALEGMQK